MSSRYKAPLDSYSIYNFFFFFLRNRVKSIELPVSGSKHLETSMTKPGLTLFSGIFRQL